MNWEVIIKWLPRLAQGATLTLELVGHRCHRRADPCHPDGHRSRIPALAGARPAVRLHFLLSRHAIAGATVSGLLRPGAVRCSASGATVAVSCAIPFWCAVITMTLHTAATSQKSCAARFRPCRWVKSRRRGRWACQSGKRCFTSSCRVGLPAYSNEVILMLKASALASTVTLLELTGMARTIIARTYLPVEIFFAAGMFYLVMTFVLVQGFRLLEKLLRVDASQGR